MIICTCNLHNIYNIFIIIYYMCVCYDILLTCNILISYVHENDKQVIGALIERKRISIFSNNSFKLTCNPLRAENPM